MELCCWIVNCCLEATTEDKKDKKKKQKKQKKGKKTDGSPEFVQVPTKVEASEGEEATIELQLEAEEKPTVSGILMTINVFVGVCHHQQRRRQQSIWSQSQG